MSKLSLADPESETPAGRSCRSSRRTEIGPSEQDLPSLLALRDAYRRPNRIGTVIIGAGFDAAVHAQDYVVLGTIDRGTWRRGVTGGAQLLDIRAHMADFKKYLKVDVIPAHWERSDHTAG